MTISYWLCAGVSILSAGVSFGFSVIALRGQSSIASYAFVRSLALLLVAIVAIFTGEIAFVAATALAMTIVQLADAVIGARSRDRLRTLGPALTGLVNLAVLVWMLMS